jgi:hypothetical protein
MAKTKRKKRPEVLAVLQLSTGYEVPIEADDVMPGGVDHLAKALIGEILFPAAKRHGWKKAKEIVANEIIDAVQRLSGNGRTVLLGAFIWEFFYRKWARLAKKMAERR